jgi:hypothetical protein
MISLAAPAADTARASPRWTNIIGRAELAVSRLDEKADLEWPHADDQATLAVPG